MRYTTYKTALQENGYAIVPEIYTDQEISAIQKCIQNADIAHPSTKIKTVFAIRQLLKEIPELAPLLFTKNVKELIHSLSDANYFVTKALYFDKPSDSNWFVGYHQDLSITVDQKVDVENYRHWTFKKGQYGVQPPVEILNDTITLRIHLDDTNKNNGALKVLPKSHLNGIISANANPYSINKEHICEVKKGGVMLMKPLTFHASNRTTNGKQRRVIHIELNKHPLKAPLQWLEKQQIRNNS